MPRDPKHFVVADPATFDGNPYEVADRALAQASAVADVLTDALEQTYPMLRSADFERQIALNGNCDDDEFENSGLAKRFKSLHATLADAKRTLAVLRKAASFDPKHPPKE